MATQCNHVWTFERARFTGNPSRACQLCGERSMDIGAAELLEELKGGARLTPDMTREEPDSMRLTPELQAKLEGVRAAAKVRHEKSRKAARRNGRVDYPMLPYECSWAYEQQFMRENS